MSKITLAEVRRLADLAQIGLSEAETKQITGELERIVNFVERLQAVDTNGVKPTDQVTGLVDVFRPDEVRHDFSRQQLLANAPDQQDGFFKVKRVLDND